MSQSTKLSSACIVACVATLCGCGNGTPEDASVAATPQVTVVTLRARPVTLTREVSGRTRAFLVAEVRPQVSAIVKRRLFTEGSHVEAGQPLYDLDDAIYRAEHENARAGLRKAQAVLQAAQFAATRSRELIRIHAISAQDDENAIVMQAQAQADVAAARAAVTSSGVSLAYAHIVAPIAGRIGKSTVTQGALVTAEQPAALATIQQLDPLYVDVNQTSSDWLALQRAVAAGRVQADGAGATARILLEDGSEYGHQGKLQFADVTVDPATGNLQLRAIVPNPELLLLPGMYVRAVLSEGALTDGLLVPQQAIARDPKGNASALVIGEDSKVEPRRVRVSRTIGDQWLVEEGLAAGDRVIVEGVQKVEHGMTVQALEQSFTEATRANAFMPPAGATE